MPLEAGTFISDLVPANPTAADAKSFGDDHLRLLKSTIKTTFPNITGAVTPSHVELNYITGLTAQPAAKDGSNIATPAPGDNSTKIATTAFVVNTALTSTLPGQTGNAGKFLGTDGSSATWRQVYPALSVSTSGKVLTNDGAVTSWVQAIPPISAGVVGQFLTNDGAGTVWAAPTAYLPLAGGTMAGPVTFNNETSINAKDVGGTARLLLKVGSDNNVYLVNAGGNRVRFFNQALTAEIFGMDNGGATNITGRTTTAGLTTSQSILMADGTQASPSLSWTSDGAQDTGLYHIGDGIIGIVCNGVLVGRFTTSGFEAIGITQRPLP